MVAKYIKWRRSKGKRGIIGGIEEFKQGLFEQTACSVTSGDECRRVCVENRFSVGLVVESVPKGD